MEQTDPFQMQVDESSEVTERGSPDHHTEENFFDSSPVSSPGNMQDSTLSINMYYLSTCMSPTQRRGLASSLLAETQQLEKQLKDLLSTEGAEKSVFKVRRSIRDRYLKVMYTDLAFAVENDVEQNLWKFVFYKQIEELRRLLRQSTPNPKLPSSKETKATLDRHRRVQKFFRQFIRDASQFYENILEGHLKIAQIQRCGMSYKDVLRERPSDATPHLALLTCHRCLIFLGDLERYIQMVGDGSRNWSKAERHYRQALELLPENGNPHNQLAVLATYQNNNLAAVHRYFRSLAVTGQPFNTALQNLRLIFDKNYVKVLKYKQKDLEAGLTPNYDNYINDLKRVDTFIVKLYGILYTNIDVEIFLPIERSVVKKLDILFFRPVRQSVRRFSDLEKHRFASFAMQVLTGCIFLVHRTADNSSNSCAPSQDAKNGRTRVDHQMSDKGASVSSPEKHLFTPNIHVGKRSDMSPGQRTSHAYACTLIFDFMSLVLRSVDRETLTLISVVSVFCDWLKLHANILTPEANCMGETETNSRRQFWTNLAELYQHICLQKHTDSCPTRVSLEEEVELGGFCFVRGAYPSAKRDFAAVRKGECDPPVDEDFHRDSLNNSRGAERRQRQVALVVFSKYAVPYVFKSPCAQFVTKLLTKMKLREQGSICLQIY